MSLGVGIEALRRMRAGGRAIVGFSIYDLEQGMGVVRAAEALGAPVLLQAGSSAFAYAGREPLARLALGLAEAAEVPVGVHLDHSTDPDEVAACLRLGYGSVMFDGSHLPFAENVARTRAVVDAARAAGAWVEGELAGIGGDEDESSAAPGGGLTDPDEAAAFVAETGVDALAVAIGNVHGMAGAPVDLDLDLLARIAAVVDAPLVLHGASGLPEADVRRAIELGVAKLNVNTELRRALRGAVIDVGTDPPAGDGVPALMGPLVEAVQAAAAEKLEAFTVDHRDRQIKGAPR
jgi:tagatose 1,6-diphosphate aldolase GatY/KbaY